MKLLRCRLFLWLLAGLWAYAPMALFSQEKELLITSRFDDITLGAAINQLQLKYGLEFEYDPKLIRGVRLERIRITRQTLGDAMQLLLQDSPLGFALIGKRVILLPQKSSRTDLPEEHYEAEKFDFTLKGIITDAKSGESLPNATVVVKGTNIGAITNLDGYFTLFKVPSDTAILEVRYLGYHNKRVKLNPKSDIERLILSLEQADYELATVVISTQEANMVESKGISHLSISPAQIAALPSLGEKDIFRSLQLLPGISGTNETSSGLFVRGGTPDQNLILFDGFTVYHVDHFYGFFSAFNSEAIKDVQFYKGGFDAKYGGRLSSVVELTGKSGNKNEFDMGAGLSALSANLRFEVPLGKKANFFVAGRRSYTDIIQSGLFNKINDLVGPETPDAPQNQGNGGGFPGGGRGGRFGGLNTNVTEPTFYFYDLNSKFTYTPNQKDVFSISFYNGEDNLDNSFDNNQIGLGRAGNTNISNITNDIANWGNWGLSTKWARQWNERLYSNAVLAYSNYFSDRDRITAITIENDTTREIRNGLIEQNDVSNLSLRIDNEYQIDAYNQLGFGVEINQQSVEYQLSRNDTISIIDRSSQGNTYAAYLQNKGKVGNNLSYTIGLRANYYDLTTDFFLEPRLSLGYKIGDQVQLKAAYGQYHQFTNRIVREDIQQGSRDFWLLADGEDIPIGAATHYIAGISWEDRNWLVDIEAFYKDLDGLTEFSERISQGGIRPGGPQQQSQEFFFQGTGVAKGIEFLLQRKIGAYTGWLSYTLSQVRYDFPAFGEEPFPALHDQTHETKIVNTLKVGNWTLGATWVYGTGKPYTSPVGGYTLTLLDGTEEDYTSVGAKNAFRLPAYHRMDLSATLNFNLGNSKASTGLSIFNVYGRKNIWYKEFQIEEGELIETNVQLLGFTPNFFINFNLR